jgi:hypothetical protein
MTDHERAERRSLRYHQVVAERIALDPSIADRALARVETWLTDGSVHREYAEGWRELLVGPRAALLAFLVDDRERARAYRQASPFAFVLSPRERWKLWAEASDQDDQTAA